VCVCVCLSVSISLERAYLWNRWTDLREIFFRSSSGGVVMSCTSGFMDDVTFGGCGPYGDAWLAAVESDVCECLVCYCLVLTLTVVV